MARVYFVQRARKDNPVAKRGESYYWWQFRGMPKMYSKNKPSRSQTVRSPFYQELFAIEDVPLELTTIDVEQFTDHILPELEDLKNRQQDSLDNMPESLSSSPTAELLEERQSSLETFIDELQSLVDDIDDGDTDEDRLEKWENLVELFRGGSGL